MRRAASWRLFERRAGCAMKDATAIARLAGWQATTGYPPRTSPVTSRCLPAVVEQHSPRCCFAALQCESAVNRTPHPSRGACPRAFFFRRRITRGQSAGGRLIKLKRARGESALKGRTNRRRGGAVPRSNQISARTARRHFSVAHPPVVPRLPRPVFVIGAAARRCSALSADRPPDCLSLSLSLLPPSLPLSFSLSALAALLPESAAAALWQLPW